MTYGHVPMKTITLRVTEAEQARLDELARLLARAEASGRWYEPRRGRGDVVRLAVQLLEQRVTGDGDGCPAGQARRANDYGAPVPLEERVTKLQAAAADASGVTRGRRRPRDTRTPAAA